MANKILCVANILAFPLAKPACDHGPMSSYEPDPKDAALFAKHRAARKVIKDTRKPVMEAAERAVRGGATNQELAEWTGLTAENFRKLAESLGVNNRVKAPTVGREVEAKRAGVAQPAPEPNERPSPTEAGEQQSARPPVQLGLAEEIRALSLAQARRMVAQADTADFTWMRGVRKRQANIDPQYLPYVLAHAAWIADKAQLPDA